MKYMTAALFALTIMLIAFFVASGAARSFTIITLVACAITFALQFYVAVKYHGH